ncbi:MAG: glutamine-hydrolyzing carbamoyl-phosphate synthase small subunit [Alphaproteobacteria bacterium]
MPAVATDDVAATGTATAALALADGTVLYGQGIGAAGLVEGEVCFNTAMTGYQEILTDPSYAGQIITFTFPHIGNVGTNPEDVEAAGCAARGLVLRAAITEPSNWRAAQPLDHWLRRMGLVGIAGIDTRRLTRLLRSKGAQNVALCHDPKGGFDAAALVGKAKAWPGLEGVDMAREVSCTQSYDWTESTWALGRGYAIQDHPRFHIVAVDYGAKRNILRSLAASGCRVTVVPAAASAADILGRAPDGIFLSNGPADPAATGAYAIPVLRELIASGKPIFGICLGHQLLGLTLGGRSRKMLFGHRGANHPVKELATGRVEVTSQNHGFEISAASLPAGVTPSHVSLFDGSLEGLKVEGKPIFSVQYHPEASPGPQDAQHLFQRFVKLMEAHG